MATRRISKGPVASAEAEPPVVKQVVEEVSAESTEEVVGEIKEEAKKIEEDAEKLEEGLQGEGTKEHQVVSELYRPKPPDIPSDIIKESTSSIKPLLIWSLVVVGIALLTGGTLLVAMKGLQNVSFFAQPTPTPTPVPTPTPTPQPAAAKREDITVGVLNGGGVAGSGAKMKAFLEKKGYPVEDVRNADEFTYEETVIKVKPGKERYLALLQKDIEESYTVGSTSPDLPENSPYDAQVIVGKK